MTPKDREFFEDLVQKVGQALQPDFKAQKTHVTTEINALRDEIVPSLKKIEKHLGL